MPQDVPEFQIVQEAEDMVAKIVDKYPDKFSHIAPDAIGCASITNKTRPPGQAFNSTIVGIKPPISLYTQKRYIIWFYKNVWESLTPAQKGWMLIAKLMRIDETMSGKVLPEDLKDVKCLVKALGVDYENNVGVVDPLDQKQTF